MVSSIFPILSEYRVYVFQGEIDTISLYNGDATVLPDIDLIKKAVSLINNNRCNGREKKHSINRST